MIVVQLGTHKLPFTRMVDYCNQIVEAFPKQDIVLQHGNTQITNLKDEVKRRDFYTTKKLYKIIEQADLVISHCGVSTLHEVLSLKKKLIMVPRLQKYNEHNDNHQMQIADYYKNKNLAYLHDENRAIIEEVQKVLQTEFAFATYHTDNKKMIEIIERLIQS